MHSAALSLLEIVPRPTDMHQQTCSVSLPLSRMHPKGLATTLRLDTPPALCVPVCACKTKGQIDTPECPDTIDGFTLDRSSGARRNRNQGSVTRVRMERGILPRRRGGGCPNAGLPSRNLPAQASGASCTTTTDISGALCLAAADLVAKHACRMTMRILGS